MTDSHNLSTNQLMLAWRSFLDLDDTLGDEEARETHDQQIKAVSKAILERFQVEIKFAPTKDKDVVKVSKKTLRRLIDATGRQDPADLAPVGVVSGPPSPQKDSSSDEDSDTEIFSSDEEEELKQRSLFSPRSSTPLRGSTDGGPLRGGPIPPLPRLAPIPRTVRMRLVFHALLVPFVDGCERTVLNAV